MKVDSCCNMFTFEAEAAGNSFALSLGGNAVKNAQGAVTSVVPFLVNKPTSGALDTQCGAGCCEIIPPEPIPGIGSRVCMPESFPMGTYMVWARATLFSLASPAPNGLVAGAINPGAKISIRYIEDCNNPINPVEVAGYMKPCSCCPVLAPPVGMQPTLTASQAVFPLATGYIPNEVVQVAGQTMIYSATCAPAFDILAINGCPPQGEQTPPDADLFVANIQIVALFITSRDLVNCGGFPLASILPFSQADGCPGIG